MEDISIGFFTHGHSGEIYFAANCFVLEASMDRLTQDFLHKLELDGLDYKERAKVATQLAKCRQARRECKDTVEILEPLVQFLESDKGKNLLNLVREALGKTRKVEERMETRTYIPRVLEQEATT